MPAHRDTVTLHCYLQYGMNLIIYCIMYVVARIESSGQLSQGTNLLSDDQLAYDLVANIDQCLPNTQLDNCFGLRHADGDEQTSP
jgi:hypothetical protein